LGKFQDGGLRHNNPINIALWESNRIWGHKTSKDVVLSLGTGTQASATTTQATESIYNGFIPRLCRSFLTSLDGELIWRDLLNHLGSDAGNKFFRLNITFKNKEPRLDDVKAMDRLSQGVDDSNEKEKLADIKLALLASCFFFELKQAPRFDPSGFFVCHGEIRVRYEYTKVFMALRGISGAPIEFSKDNTPLGPIDPEVDFCAGCLRFRKKICFFVRHVSEAITISMAMDKFRHSISGFPQSMAWFSQQQFLHFPFYSEVTLNSSKSTCPCMQSTDLRRRGLIKRRLSGTHPIRKGSKRAKMDPNMRRL